MGILNKCKVYTVGGMQYTDGRDWRNKVKAELCPRGITVFDPYHKPFLNEIKEDEEARAALKEWMDNEEYDRVTDRMKAVRNDDLRICDLSDFIIMYIDPRLASWGSAEEFFTVNRMKKPIFLAIEGGKTKCPLWIMGTIPHKYIYSTVEEIIECVKRIDDGTQVMDNYRWRLLKLQYR